MLIVKVFFYRVIIYTSLELESAFSGLQFRRCHTGAFIRLAVVAHLQVHSSCGKYPGNCLGNVLHSLDVHT